MKVEKVSQQNLLVRAPRVSHQAKAVPSGMGGRPRSQTPVRLPNQCSDTAVDGALRVFVVAERPPIGVGETGFGAVEGCWRQPTAAGWRGRMGMPRTSRGLGPDEVGETAEVGEPPEGDEEAVVVSTLPVLCVSCDSRVEVLLLCGVAVAHEKAKGGEPVDDMLPPRAG